MYKFIVGLLVVAALTPFISYAALTDQQIASVAELVRSFGADESAVRGVTAALGGTVLGATTDLYPSYCPKLTVALRQGSRDSTTGGQVTELQKFLSGYYDLPPVDIVTGYFGPTTHGLVVKFQTQHGLIAQGYVGPQTRAKIADVCDDTTPSSLLSPLPPGAICPAIAYTPIECATGTPTPRYDAYGCQNGWTCSTASSTAAVLNVTLDASSPAYKLVAAGTNDVVIGAFKLRAGGESIMVQKIGLKLTSGVPGDLNKVTVYDGATKVGEGFFFFGSSASVTLLSNVLVPKDTDKVLTIKGDFSPIGTGEAVTVSGHLVQVDFLSGQGIGTSSGTIVNATGSTAVAGVRVAKSFLTVTDISSTLTPGGLADGRLMRFKVTADVHGPVGLTQLFVNVAPYLAQVKNVNISGFEDSSFSTPISGVTSSGALRSTDACPTGCIVNVLSNIGITTSGGTPTAVQIPAGSTRYFEVRGTVTGIQSGASVTTKLVGDGAYTGPVSAVSLVGKDAYFIWSPNSTTTAVRNDQDWFTGYGVSGLPAEGIKYTRTTTVVPTSSISVTAPNGGEQWEIGQLNTITWSPYGYNPDVNTANQVSVYLQKLDGTTVGKIMDTGKASLHTYFRIDSYDKWATPGQYYVYAKNSVTGATDRSDVPFTLLAPRVDLKVNGSDGPISLTTGQTVRLSWRTRDVERCRVYGVNIGTVPLADGSYSVSVNGDIDGVYRDGTIRMLCSKYNFGEWGDSVSVNIASVPASIRVVSPNGGELLKINEPYTIRWTHSGLSKLSIALYKNDQWMKWLHTDQVATYPSGTADGTYQFTWTPGAVEAEAAPLGSVFKIYITGSKADGMGYVDDKSDAPFGFSGATQPPVPATLSLTSPQSGSTVTVGNPIPISWSFTNAPKNSQILLTVKNVQPSSPASGVLSGGSWQSTLIPTTNGTGSYSWTTGPGYLDYTGTYQVTAQLKQCDPNGCSYSYNLPLPVFATSNTVQFTVAPRPITSTPVTPITGPGSGVQDF